MSSSRIEFKLLSDFLYPVFSFKKFNIHLSVLRICDKVRYKAVNALPEVQELSVL